jgi:hypothetical protein
VVGLAGVPEVSVHDISLLFFRLVRQLENLLRKIKKIGESISHM